MNSANTQAESEIRDHLEGSQQRTHALLGELRGIDVGLEELAEEREQYALLSESCAALEKLSAGDAADLFWDGLTPTGVGQAHLRIVRERIDAFDGRIHGIEASRQAVLAKMQLEEETADYLEDDLYEHQKAEEDRKREWVVERELNLPPDSPAVMPWSRGSEADQRFRRTLAISLLVSLVLGVILPFIPLPIPDRLEAAEIPERFTRLLKEQRFTPPPVQEQAKQEEKPPEPEKETPLLAEEGTITPTEKPQKAKPSAGSKGILAFRDKFSSLADSAEPAKLGAQARISNSGAQANGRVTRSLVTTQGPGSSGGINLASLSRDTGGGNGEGIAGVQVTQATSSIGTAGGTGDRPMSGGPGSARTDEEIQIVFDRHKSSLYRLYNRELRNDPTLQGQMVLRMTILPDGSVSLCELSSSDMKAPRLAAQVLDRVKTFDFGAKDGIPAITILYPIDFLPAS